MSRSRTLRVFEFAVLGLIARRGVPARSPTAIVSFGTRPAIVAWRSIDVNRSRVNRRITEHWEGHEHDERVKV